MNTTTNATQAATQMQQGSDAGSWESAAAQAQQQQPTPPQQPAQQPAAAQSETGVQPPAAQPAAPQPVIITPDKRGGLLGVVDSIADALTGKTRPEIGTDQQGNKYVKETTLTHGQQWARIGAMAAAGAAEGFGAGRGNNPGAAASAGFRTGIALAEKQEQARKEMTAEARQQNLDNANNQMRRMQMAEAAFRISRLGVEASQQDVKFAQEQQDRLVKEGGTVLGTMANPGQITDILKVNPETIPDMVQKHLIELVPHVNADGKRDGITVIKMPNGYRNQMLPAGSVFHTFDQSTGKLVAHNASDPMTVGERDNYDLAAQTAQYKFLSDQAELKQKAAQTAHAEAQTQTENEMRPVNIAEKKAQTTAAYASAEHQRAETKALNEATSSTQINANAQGLVDGTIDPSNLSKRAKSYDATLAAANQYSMQKYGRPFDVAKAASDYKYATSVATTNTFNYLNSLTGRDNQSGNLGQLVQLSNQIKRTNFPALNDAAAWARLQAGDPQMAAYHAALVEVSDQLAKVMQGGGGSATSDAKLRQAAEIFNAGFSKDQIKAVATDTIRPLLANRKNEMIGDNRYLQQWHGHQQAAPNTPPAPPVQQGSARAFVDGQWGYIPNGNVAAFKAAHPNAQVLQ